MTDPVLEGAAHVVQLARTPVFLLSGVAALVNVFSTRLGRVSDQADKLSEQRMDTPGHDLRLELLRWRSRALDFAVVLAALAGASTCGAALALFLGAVQGSAGASLLFWLFGGAIVLTVVALAFFVMEMLLAARGVRRLLDRSRRGPKKSQAHADRESDAPEGAEGESADARDHGEPGEHGTAAAE